MSNTPAPPRHPVVRSQCHDVIGLALGLGVTVASRCANNCPALIAHAEAVARLYMPRLLQLRREPGRDVALRIVSGPLMFNHEQTLNNAPACTTTVAAHHEQALHRDHKAVT